MWIIKAIIRMFKKFPVKTEGNLWTKRCEDANGKEIFLKFFEGAPIAGYTRYRSTNVQETVFDSQGKLIATGSCGWDDSLVTAMIRSGEHTAKDAIMIAVACERCSNALAYYYGLNWGYKIGSKQYKECGTSCKFCEPK